MSAAHWVERMEHRDLNTQLVLRPSRYKSSEMYGKVAKVSRPVKAVRKRDFNLMGLEAHATSNPNYGVLSRAWRTCAGVTLPWSPPQRVRT